MPNQTKNAALIERARARAAGGRCVAVSFDPHPDLVLAKEFRALPPLTPLPEKHDRLAAGGVELHVLPFTRELAALASACAQSCWCIKAHDHDSNCWKYLAMNAGLAPQ